MKQYSFNSIAFIIWILTLYCKVSNGEKPWSVERKDVMGIFDDIYLELELLKSAKDNEIQSLKLEKDNEIKLMQKQIKELKQRAAPTSCAQLSMTGLMNDGKKEWIDPGGRSTGNIPIEVECTGDGESVAGQIFEADVPQLSDKQVFEATISKNDLAQMRTLIDRSLECTQELEIECLGAPLNFDGQDYFHLIDYSRRKISIQNISSQNDCDNKDAFLVNESIQINDTGMLMLPLRGFEYGPIDDGSTFHAKIKKLSCKPNMTKEESLTTNNRLLTLEDNALAHKEEVNENKNKIHANHPGHVAVKSVHMGNHAGGTYCGSNAGVRIEVKDKFNQCITKPYGEFSAGDTLDWTGALLGSCATANFDPMEETISLLIKTDITGDAFCPIWVQIILNDRTSTSYLLQLPDGDWHKMDDKDDKTYIAKILGIFSKCENQWCRQSGLTKAQYTKCGSVSNAGKTCNNPEIRYGTTEGGIPHSFFISSPPNSLNQWCQQLGGTFERVTKGQRTGYAVTWGPGWDEDAEKWVAFDGDGKWYNGVLKQDRKSVV